MKVVKQIVVSMGVLVFIQYSLQAVIIGSNTAVSIQGTAVFPQADVNNTALGFASFAGGIVLEDNSTTCSFASQFPIASILSLNGGSLSLQTPLICLPGTSLSTGGIIRGNNLNWQFTTALPTYLPSNPDLALNFINTANPGSAIRSVDWSFDDQYILTVASGSPHLRVYSFNGTSLTLAASVALAGAGFSGRWHPSNYRIAVAVTGGGGTGDFQLCLFTPPSTLAVTATSANFPGNGSAVAWHPTGDWLAGGATGGNQFKIWPVTGGSLGTVLESSQATVSQNAISWSRTGTYVAIGVSTSPELRVLAYDGVTITTNATAAIAATVTAVDYSSTGSLIAVGLSAGTQRLRIYRHNPVAGTLTQVFALTDSITVNSVAWSSDGLHLVVGRTAGTGLELTIYDWDEATLNLIATAISTEAASVVDANFTSDAQYVLAAGSTTANIASVYTTALTPIQEIYYLNNLNVQLAGDLVIQKPVFIEGTCSISGNGNMVSLINTGSLIISSGASLLLDSLTLTGLGAHNVFCLDSTATLIVSDAQIVMNDNYSFDQGAMEVVGEVIFTGTNTCVYQTDQSLTINSNSRLYFDSGTTFYYAPSSAANNLVVMEDESAELYLYETTLQLTTTGLQLTKGRFTVEGLCPVVSSATQQSQGLQLGDGVSAANNIDLYILPESSLAVQSGYVVYNNV